MTLAVAAIAAPGKIQAGFVATPPLRGVAAQYVTNRSPLVGGMLLKLPIGSIKPKGWLKHQLELEAKGMTGRLQEISRWCKFENSAWASPTGAGEHGWEELPYWLKGYGDLGYVLEDANIIREARRWIDATLGSQEADGFFGPRENKKSLGGHPDLWPHMVMLNVLQSHYEFTADSRVLPFMTRYMRWLNTQPGDAFGRGYWPKLRFGDTIETALWLYNRTGEPFLLELATKIHENMARWDSGIIDWHNVNIAQGFREPAVYYAKDGNPKLLGQAERNYQEIMGLFGQFPGGGFGGDENCRKGYHDPRQGFETCGIVEFMHSFEMLSKISGDTVWADRCEELAFNSLPAAMTPDQKALHYLTSANQIQLDKGNKAPAIQNSGNMFAYSAFEVFRCCQHNVSHGWPYFAEELWLGTSDGGLCASLYSASEVTAKVAGGTKVRIIESTEYPFDETIRLEISTDKPVLFPLYMRVPGWCQTPKVSVNGKHARLDGPARGYIRLAGVWKNGDRVELQLPMQTTVKRWSKNKDAASIYYGPLAFSLQIDERWRTNGGTKTWPEYEVFPSTPWNYALVLNDKAAAKRMAPKRRFKTLPEQPFTPQTVPLTLKVKARRVPEWQQDKLGMVGKLQASPVRTDTPVEWVTLIPMGAARLRITSFPVAATGSEGSQWLTQANSSFTASHCNDGDSVDSLEDEFQPKSSDDTDIPRFTWWDRKGTREWLQKNLNEPRAISSVGVYWFDDESRSGGCKTPASWEVHCLVGGEWKLMQTASPGGVEKNTLNTVSFPAVTTKAVRVTAHLKPGSSAGVLAVQIH